MATGSLKYKGITYPWTPVGWAEWVRAIKQDKRRNLKGSKSLFATLLNKEQRKGKTT